MNIPGLDDVLGAGVAHHQAGRLAEAEACYRRVLAAQPNHADALNMLGALAHQVGRSDVAVELIRRAIEIDGDNPGYFYHLGGALQGQGKLDEAVAAFRQTIRLEPDLADAHCNLGNLLRSQGKLDEAVAAYRQAVRIRPGMAEFRLNLGIGLKEQGKLDEAAAAYRGALQIKPDYAEAQCNLGMVLREQGRLDEAVNACLEAIRMRPAFADAHLALGNALWQQGRLGEAIMACHQAIRINPDHAAAYCALGNALYEQGKPEEAIAAYSEAVRRKPDLAGWGSNLLLCLNYDERVAAATLFEAHRDWAGRHASPPSWPVSHANDRSPERRLKVGYVSPDFRSHSVAHFLEPLLTSHDRNAIEVFCYAEVSWSDARTERFKQLADHWVVTVGMSDEELAERIRRAGIDILVDLAGHTAKNRLLVFARKPAPVQVTWLGYPNTTGLTAIEYRLVDGVTDPIGQADVLATEALVRLPGGFLCYDAAHDAPQPAPPPCLAAGAVTFGSFNSAAKLSGATLDAWAALLTRLPTARLLLKGKAFADPATCASFLERLGKRGVAAQRVELAAYVPEAEHLASYSRVDIALDPFPYNGTTTTCEALWMGVPVVALRGDRHAGRVGASLLAQLGLNDLIADSVEEYVEIAAALAGDPARLADLRRSLRPRMAGSPLCDAPSFARKIEAAYRTMWRNWCHPPAETHDIGGDAPGAGRLRS
jgi:protein O-GlcNAc transferase